MQVKFFHGDGLNISAEDLGYGNRDWKVGDQIEIEEWDEENGSYEEYWTISGFNKDTDSDEMGARISYSGSSLEC